MLEVLIFTLFVLWLLGFIRVGGGVLPDAYLFSLNNVNISLWNIITLLIILWVIGLLPSPFSEIASVLMLLWILALIGILPIVGLSNILMLAIIIGLVLYLFSWRSPSV